MKTRWFLFGSVLAVVLFTLAVGLTQAQSPEPPEAPLALEPAAATWYTCTPVRVASFATRIHVRCAAAAPNGIWYFAYPTSDTANASRFLSLLSTALVAGKQVNVLYDPADTSGAAYGCLAADCRALRAVEMLP